jgi:Leucine-rich repeat (LRR) protein
LGEKKKLTYFSLDHNKIDSLDLSGCPELEELIFVSNYPLRLQKLFSLEISNFNGIECCLKLRKLDLRSSKLKGKLDFLSNLINLEEIDLSYNNFYGSLEPLKKLTNLKVINIENSTRVKNDIENLPSSLEKLSLNSNNRRIKRKLKNAPVVKNNFSVVVFTTYDYQS